MTLFHQKNTKTTLYIPALLLPLLIVWCVNILTLVELQQCCCGEQRDNGLPASSLLNRENNQLAKTLIVMSLAFTLALLPAIIMIIVEGVYTPYLDLVNYQRSFHPTNFTIITSFHFLASIILLSNSFTNCIIYSVRSEKFKKNIVGLRLEIYKFWLKIVKSGGQLVSCKDVDGTGFNEDNRPSVTSMTWLPSSPTLRRDTKRPTYVLTVDREEEESGENGRVAGVDQERMSSEVVSDLPTDSTNQTSEFSKPSDLEMS